MKIQLNIRNTAETAAAPRRKRRSVTARPDAEQALVTLPGINLAAISPHAARANLLDGQSYSASARAATANQLLRQAAALPPIPLPHRAALEARFGRPLGSIAVYANPPARAALQLLDAQAAAHDGALFLAEPRPAIAILAHEVIHVLQTRQEPYAAAPATATPIAPDHPAEREAATLTENAGVLAQARPPLAVQAQLPPQALALRRTAIPTPQTTAAPETLPRRAERPRPESTVTPEPPARPEPAQQRQATEETALPAGAGETAPVELPPAPEPGVSEADVAARQAELAQAEAALQQAESPEALMAAFAAAPPTVKAQRVATLGDETNRLAQSEQAAFNADLPDMHAELNSQVEPAAPLTVAAPEQRAIPLEEGLPPPAPEPEIAPTPDLGRYDANAGIATDVSRLLSGEPENRAGQLAERLHDVRTSDPAIATSPGAPPQVPLEGANDPARIDDQTQAGFTQARQSRDAVQQAVLNGPGPEQAQPIAMDEAYAVGELQQPEISAPPLAAGPQAYLDLGLPPEAQVAFDQQQQAAMQASLGDARAQVDTAGAERDRQRDEAVATAQEEAQQQSQQADEQQRAGVADARGRIQSARQQTLDAQQAAIADLETQAESRRAADRASLDERVQNDEQQVAQRYNQAETAARTEVVAGEQRAETARRNAEREANEQSWWDRAVDFVRSAFEALTSLIGEIFDAVRAAVNAVLDAAKAFAEAVIDAAASFINGLIAAFGAFLQSLVTTLLGDIFPELAAALNAAIDDAVAFAQSIVTAAADTLKAGIAALVEGLRAGLNAIISAYQAAVQLALTAVQAALTGDWAALARMALETVLQVAGIDPESFYAFIGRAQETFQLILDDPAGFVGNLVDAFLASVRNFSANFLTHLQAGIIGWLTGAIGGAGITIPERFDLMGVLSLVQQILGLTWDRLRERAVRLIGETAVSMLEFVADYLRTLIEGGWDALWQRIQDDLASLRDLVLDSIKNFLLERIVMAAITRLATMFNPVGAIINLILAAYNLFTFLRDQLAHIIEVVQTVVNAIGDIARGVIQPAAQRVEEVLARLLPLAIDLLARLLGLGNIGARVREIIEQVRNVVDRAIDRLIERVRGLFRGGGASGTAAAAAPGVPDQLVEPAVARLTNLSPALMREIEEANTGFIVFQSGGSAEQITATLLREHRDARFDQASGRLTLPATHAEPLNGATSLRELGALLAAQTGVARIILQKSENGFSFVGQINPPAIIATGQEVTLVAQIGIRGADNRVISEFAKAGDLEDILLQFRAEQLGSDDITYDEIRRNRNYALANIQVSGRTPSGLSVVFTRQVATSDLLAIFSSGSGRGPNEEVQLGIEVIGEGGRTQVVREGPADIGSTIFVEPPRILTADPTELSRFVTRLAPSISGRKKYSAQLDRHSEQAIWQLVRMQDAELARWIRELGVSQIYQMVVNIHSEREMCRVCAAASNHMIANMRRELPAVYDALQAFQIQFTAATQVTASLEFEQRAPRTEPGSTSTTQVTEASGRGEPERPVTPERVAGVVREREEQLAPPEHPRLRGGRRR